MSQTLFQILGHRKWYYWLTCCSTPDRALTVGYSSPQHLISVTQDSSSEFYRLLPGNHASEARHRDNGLHNDCSMTAIIITITPCKLIIILLLLTSNTITTTSVMTTITAADLLLYLLQRAARGSLLRLTEVLLTLET